MAWYGLIYRLSWSWSCHLWPTEVEWHRWVLEVELIVPSKGVDVGEAPKALSELSKSWITTWYYSSQHQGGDWGWNIWKVKTPWWFQSRATAMALERRLILAIPKMIFKKLKESFIKYLSWHMTNEHIDTYCGCYLTISSLLNCNICGMNWCVLVDEYEIWNVLL